MKVCLSRKKANTFKGEMVTWQIGSRGEKSRIF